MSNDKLNDSSGESPHPELERLIEQRGSVPGPSNPSLSPEGAREFLKQRLPEPEEQEPVGDVLNFKITDEGVPVRVYVPDSKGPYPTIVFFHGGGWVLGDRDTHDTPCRVLANETGAMVVSVDYGLAPEHKFPAQLEQCYNALEWVFDDAQDMQVDTNNVAVAGDSAGGNLAAAVALLARDRGGPDIDRQVLIYPVLDHSFDTPSYQENAEGYLISKDVLQWCWDHYLESDIDGKNPYASPLQAKNLEGLPPATVITCGFDPLRDEGAAYANRLENAGVQVNHINFDEYVHGIIQFLDEPISLQTGRDILEVVIADLQESFE